MKKEVLIDCNNFYSPSGGGVRRYHLQKLDFFSQREDLIYVHIQPAAKRETIEINEHTFIEKIPAFRIPGEWEYRFSIKSQHLRAVFKKYNPDFIEIGSPYFLPPLVKKAIKKLPKQPKVIGFWHSDFPVTYVKRFWEKYGNTLGTLWEGASWQFAKKRYAYMHAVFVPSELIAKRMNQRSIQHTHFVPLGVDTKLFHPAKKDPELVEKLKAGKPERLTIFFPHRFCDEKGLRMTIEAYPVLCEMLECEPALVFAGTGPDIDLVEEAAAKYPHVRFLGFIKSDQEMARWSASCELGLALSGWETFGLSILEAMASGQIIVGANTGAALEHVEKAQCGRVISHTDSASLINGIYKVATDSKRAEYAKNARLYAEQFTWEQCFEKELRLYRSV